ncbi:MAG: response regulator [Bacteroidia bacterium]|nr:response regulator [Bacteroidia bacterium]
MRKIRIVLIEDNPSDLATLMNDFDRVGMIQIVHYFMSGADFLTHLSEHAVDFDALVTDYHLQILNGLETCRNIIAKNSQFKHLLVSHGYYSHVMKDMMSMGSQNYCQKTGEVIHQLLPRIMDGKVTYEDSTQIHIWEALTKTSALQAKDESHWLGNLSPLDKKIIKHVCFGQNSSDIAKALGYETSSIEKYRGTILKMLDLKNSQQLTAWAFSHGLINASIVFSPNANIGRGVAEEKEPYKSTSKRKNFKK